MDEKLDIKNGRQSNIELLRALAMVLIVFHHFSMFSGFKDIPNLSFESYWGMYLVAFGKLGVNIFVLISGYFLINSKFKIKKLIKLWLQVVFYSFGIMIILKWTNVINIDIINEIKFLLPISYRQYWFVSTYVYMYILFPFINKLAKSMSKDMYKTLLIILTILFSVIYSLFYKSNSFQTAIGTFETLGWFIYLYLLAGYIRLYNVKIFGTQKNTIVITLLVTIAFIGMLSMSRYAKIKFNILSDFFDYYTCFNSIFVLILSVSIFNIFINWNIGQSRVINFLGHISFSVYLIQENNALRTPLWNGAKVVMQNYNINIVIMPIICAIVLFALAGIIEVIRINVIEKNLFKMSKNNKFFEKIDEKMNDEK